MVTAARAAALAGREYELAEDSPPPAQPPSPLMLPSGSPTHQPENSRFIATEASDQPEDSGLVTITETSDQPETPGVFVATRRGMIGAIGGCGVGRGVDPDFLPCEEHEDENKADSDSSSSCRNSASSEAD